ncbi:AAA ATPase [Streptomyces sviceus ATCC 29083]|uniref:AAA ATPase n=2 Tax=Streptomyces TaxID=1883 RepID=B5HUV2_STRX2|nr:AAA ATPase [Streptomyces sviceus ATCC 29083]
MLLDAADQRLPQPGRRPHLLVHRRTLHRRGHRRGRRGQDRLRPHLPRRPRPVEYSVVYIPNPMIGVRGIHEVIVNTFGQTPSHLGSRLTVQTGKVLLAEREERARTPVLVVDEAHLMSYEQLEAIRMLTNQGMDQDSPLSCLLVGQPTLRRT